MTRNSARALQIAYRTGDATTPLADGPKIIAHVCNDEGKWGKGFVLALSRRWREPEREFRAAFARGGELALGEIQLVRVSDEVEVANMIGQHGIMRRGGKPPIRYEALRAALTALARHASHVSASVHMPRIGAGLAGGDWAVIEPMIEETLCASGVPVYVYDLPSPSLFRGAGSPG